MKTKTSCFGLVTKNILTATLITLLGLSLMPCVFAQGDGSDKTVTKKNADGSVDVYDKDDPNAPSGGDESPETVPGGGGGVRYVPGTSPYTKKYSDGTVVRRNSDGSIETSDPGETNYWSDDGGGSARRAHSKKPRAKTVSKTTSTKTTTTKSAGTKTKVQTTTVKKGK